MANTHYCQQSELTANCNVLYNKELKGHTYVIGHSEIRRTEYILFFGCSRK